MAVTRETVAALLDAGQIVTVSWPGSGDIRISLQRHMIDDAMAAWSKLEVGDRAQRMGSVRAAIKRATKRMKQQRAASREIDELAADVALFVGHELMFGDGEKWLSKNPTRDEILSGSKS